MPAAWNEQQEASRRLLIGAVGYHWQRDASFGFFVSEALAGMDWPSGVELADLDYSAIYVAQDLADVKPAYDRLILISAVTRGRPAGTLYTSRWLPPRLDDGDVQARIREAGAGVVDLDHLLIIGSYFQALPSYIQVLEIEPVDVTGGLELSPQNAGLISDAVRHVRREVERFFTAGKENAP